MAQVNLKADTGRALGSRPSRRLRQTGLVPGVVYGLGNEPRHVAVNDHDLREAFHTAAGTNVLINLEIDGEEGVPTLVLEIDRHPYRNLIRHVDFVRVSLTETIETEVGLHFVGTPAGIKDGGILIPTRSTVTVEALPTEIPAAIEVDVSRLALNEGLRISDLPVIPGVRIVDDPEETLVSVLLPAAEVEVAAPTPEGEEEKAETEEGAEEEADE